jgi:hypothetical protein
MISNDIAFDFKYIGIQLPRNKRTKSQNLENYTRLVFSKLTDVTEHVVKKK